MVHLSRRFGVLKAERRRHGKQKGDVMGSRRKTSWGQLLLGEAYMKDEIKI
jgi:hypothetical protein